MGYEVLERFIELMSDTKDILIFCSKHHILHEVRECEKALPIIFPTLQKYNIDLDTFDEEEEEHIVFRIKIVADRGTYQKQYHNWVTWLINNIRPFVVSYITLSVDRE